MSDVGLMCLMGTKSMIFFFRSDFSIFWQNVLRSDLESHRFVIFGDNLVHFEPKSDTPNIRQKPKSGERLLNITSVYTLDLQAKMY